MKTTTALFAQRIALVALGAAALALTGCKDDAPATTAATPANAEFRILAGSELRDVAQKVEAFGAANGINHIASSSQPLFNAIGQHAVIFYQ